MNKTVVALIGLAVVAVVGLALWPRAESPEPEVTVATRRPTRAPAARKAEEERPKRERREQMREERRARAHPDHTGMEPAHPEKPAEPPAARRGAMAESGAAEKRPAGEAPPVNTTDDDPEDAGKLRETLLHDPDPDERIGAVFFL